MFKSVIRLLVAMTATVTLVACSSINPTRIDPFPPISFGSALPYRLDVGQLEIIPQFQPSMTRPNIEHLMPISPETATIKWAQARIKPVGTTTALVRITILDASVTETTQNGQDRYEGVLEISIQLFNEEGLPQANALARAARTKTILNSVSLNERDQALYELTEGLSHDIDTRMNQLIPQYLGPWIVH